MIWRKIIFSIHLSPALQLSSPWSPIILVSPKLSLQRGISKEQESRAPKKQSRSREGYQGRKSAAGVPEGQIAKAWMSTRRKIT